MSEVQAAVADHWRRESATIVATLVRMVGDVGLAEELAQDALVAALEQWPWAGIPDEPGAWLTTVTRRRAVDHLRRTGRLEALDDDPSPGSGPAPDAAAAQDDDVLRLMLLTCHPDLAREERTAMTLRLVAGLGTAEIARAFLLHEQQVVARIAHAKRTLAAIGVGASGDLAGRIGAVLEVVYLVFNEGYTATTGEDLLRPGLVDEALRLGRLLAAHAPDDPEAHGLLALMELQASRSAARTDAVGAPVPLDDQDRSLWDRAAIRRGVASLLRARGTEPGPTGLAGPYVLQAAIAVQHARATRPEDTDRAQVAALYDLLVAVLPTPVVRLNRAVAIAWARGPEVGLAAVDELVAEGALRDYHLLPTVRADLLGRLGRDAEARVEWRRAAALTANAAERAVLLRRADALAAAAASGPTLGPSVDRFLAREDLSAASRRSYAQTLHRVVRDLGDARPLSSLDADDLGAVLTTWDAAAAATWNRHRSTVRSFAAWLGRPELAAGLAARDVPVRPERPVPRVPDGPLRERALWAVLADSGATITEVLALDVDDLDLVVRRSGSLRWSPVTNGLLRALAGTRSAGPLFLSDRRPGLARRPGARDLCPHTGRRRLSYERAEYLFKQASNGSTLGALRAREHFRG